MRIVHGLPFFHPATRFGGPVTQVRQLCRHLAARGHEVLVVTTDAGVGPDVPRGRWVELDNYHVWYARLSRLGARPPFYAPNLAPAVREAMAWGDVAHLALSFTHVNIVFEREARRVGKPYVYAPRACLCGHRLRQKRMMKAAFLPLFERGIIRGAAAVHALTEAEREQALRQGAAPERSHVIPNGTDLVDRPDWPRADLFLDHFGLRPGGPVVLFLGRLQSIKGLDLLVRAFARARASRPEAVLVVAGPDEGGAAIVKAEARRCGVWPAVRMVGHLEGEMKLAAYRAADVFALTSYSEGFPNTVLEASACGVPMLLTDRCQVPEVARWGAGRVEPAEAGPLGEALAEMLDDPAALRTMGQNSYRLSRERFGFQQVVDQLLVVYDSVASASGEAAASA